MFQRKHLSTLQLRLEKEPRNFIQVVYGPWQVGKTTLVQQFIEDSDLLCYYVSADNVLSGGQNWIEQQWEVARVKLQQEGTAELVLMIDEVQKIPNWSEQVKKEWDSDTLNNKPIKVVLLGSSRLLLQQGLTESLAGRYEAIYTGHWTFNEMQEAFGLSLEEFVWFGGYPGAAKLINDEKRWKQYVRDSLIEASISKDILMLTRVDKPALMKRFFELGCTYSGQILSYTKILGQLQDAGNTTTLAHYLKLLDTAGLLCGIEKYAEKKLQQRASSPKFQVHNNALMSAIHSQTLKKTIIQPEVWGRWIESAIGAYLINCSLEENIQVYYWRHRNEEIDFIISNGRTKIGIEVKSGKTKPKSGISSFKNQFKPDKMLLTGKAGIQIDEFLKISPLAYF